MAEQSGDQRMAAELFIRKRAVDERHDFIEVFLNVQPLSFRCGLSAAIEE
jgi:hypothetical protein